MSRGLGDLQRRILAALPALGGSADVHTLAERIHGTAVAIGDSRYESVRRAVKALVRCGLVRRCEGRRERVKVEWDDGSRSWRDRFELAG